MQKFSDTVFTTEDGDVPVGWCSFGNGDDKTPALDSGWRQRPDGARELVHWRDGRWVSDAESILQEKASRQS